MREERGFTGPLNRVVQADIGKRYWGKLSGTGREASRMTRRMNVVQAAGCLGRERKCREGQGGPTRRNKRS